MRFGSQEGTLSCVLAPRRALYRAFWLPGGHFIVRFGSQEGTLSCVFQQLGHLCTPLLATNLLNDTLLQIQLRHLINENANHKFQEPKVRSHIGQLVDVFVDKTES